MWFEVVLFFVQKLSCIQICLNHKMINHFFCNVKLKKSSIEGFVGSLSKTFYSPVSLICFGLKFPPGKILLHFQPCLNGCLTSASFSNNCIWFAVPLWTSTSPWLPCGTTKRFFAPPWTCIPSSSASRVSMHFCTKNENDFTPTIFLHEYNIYLKI